MLVVSDTTPLNYLILIGEIPVLPRLYATVVLPRQVVAEMSHPRAPEPVRRWTESLPEWVLVRAADEGRFPALDEGEAAALALAFDLDVPLLADELATRTLAREVGVRTIGTLGILAEAHLSGLLDYEEAVVKLRATNVRIHENPIRDVRQRIAEASKES